MLQENSLQESSAVLVCLWVVLLVVSAGVAPATAAAHGDGHGTERSIDGHGMNSASASGDPCTFDRPEWREEQTVAGVHVQASKECRPDNPAVVAAATKGTNNVPMNVLMRTGLSRDAITKRNDRDGDGDPDVIHIRLEVAELNGYSNNTSTVTDAIAPGVKPSFWVFAPKTRGMVTDDSKAGRLLRMPSPPIRVEAGDTVRITLQNTHYFPHTIHFHGVDHPYEVNGSGNDGVPQANGAPVLPGESRTYEFTPRTAGTMFYHCHVVPQAHVLMGLNGMFVIEQNRSDNPVQTINVGGGKVRHPSRAISENYTAEYDLQYQGVDAELHSLPKKYDDPRVLAKKINREYDVTDADQDYFLLNGRSFPYTMRSSLVRVEPNESYRLRVLNGGSETVSLHTHGHKFTVEAYDGVELAESNEITRDVASITAAQRVDLTLNTTNDGLHSYGKGVWFMHDHREQGVTTDGLSPGGTVSMIVYESYLTDSGMPRTDANLSRFFDEAYYDGEVPFWKHLDPERFGAPPGANGTTGSSDSSDSSGDGHDHSHGTGDTTTTDDGHGGHDHSHGSATTSSAGDATGSLPATWVAGGLVAAGLVGAFLGTRFDDWR